MSDVPKIVLERLKTAGGAAGPHPDADTLTGFMEQALAGAERERILAHLAQCPACREVLAVSLPPLQAEARPVLESNHAEVTTVKADVRAARSAGWFTWPRLTWAALAAGGIVAVALLMRPTNKPDVATLSVSDERNRGAALPAKEEAVAKPSSISAEEKRADETDATKRKAEPAIGAGAGGGYGVAPGAQGKFVVSNEGLLRGERAKQGASVKGSRGANSADSAFAFSESGKADPAALERARVQAESDRISALKGAAPRREVAGASPAPPAAQEPKPGAISEMVRVEPTEPTATVESAATPDTAQPSLDAKVKDSPAKKVLMAQAQPPSPSATPVSRAKPALQKADGDQTRSSSAAGSEVASTVEVTSANVGSATNLPANGRNYTQLAVLASGQAKWVVKNGALRRSLDHGKTWQDVLGADRHILCYAARDGELWAGGQAGALLLSSDNGATWTDVHVTANGQPITAAVTHIAFDKSGAVTVTAASAGTWSTTDQGHTWTKQ
jgi:Putative zinc-finger